MWKQRPYNKDVEAKLVELGQKKLISRLLSQRNIDPNNCLKFLANDYKDLSHPHTLNGVKEAASLFCNVALKKESLAVIGDYDADGILSSVMIRELCNVFKLDCTVFLPSRIEHGYGLNEKTITSFKHRMKDKIPYLLIIADCGCNNNDEIQMLKAWGVKHVIVIDHHLPDPSKLSKSADVLINWHLQDNFGETCACGEIFHFIRGIRWLTKKVDPIEFLTYASLGILADVSPIIGDNRIIVKHGLGIHSLNKVVSSGCNVLIKKSGIFSQTLSQEDVLFKIAPRINAAGRLHKPDIAFNLLVESDLATAELMADNLAEFNDRRKVIQKKMETEAVSEVERNPLKYEHGIVLYNPEWNVGLVGIVASKIVNKYHKPTLIIGKNGDVYKGSGRSYGNANLKTILDGCKELFVNYGGHSMAAGVTIKSDYLTKTNEVFNEACQKYYGIYGKPDEISYFDVVIPVREVNVNNAVLLLDNLYPYCVQNNPEPVFLLKNVAIADVRAYSGKGWRSLNFVAEKNGEKTPLRLRMFSDKFGTEVEGKKADVYFSFPQTISTGNSKISPQCNIIELQLLK